MELWVRSHLRILLFPYGLTMGPRDLRVIYHLRSCMDGPAHFLLNLQQFGEHRTEVLMISIENCGQCLINNLFDLCYNM